MPPDPLTRVLERVERLADRIESHFPPPHVSAGLDDYLDLVMRKTCWYTTIHPLRVGALIGSWGVADPDPMIDFGFHLGAAFQIRDDVLNIVGDPKVYGKEILGDLIEGKVVIDTCNPFPNRDGEIADWALEKGAGLASAELMPGARLVRAFNAIGAARMGRAYKEPGRIGMPIAGDDPEAVAVASRLIEEIGYEPVLIGGLKMGRHLRPGTPLAGERSADEIRQIAAGLE